ncbi:MAG: flagellar biosynthesis protein FlgJ [Desulfobulbus propionicus]|nr:MAG: flagellar biosynthesis protein FlgJ [Desulfobulbus propionicus]
MKTSIETLTVSQLTSQKTQPEGLSAKDKQSLSQSCTDFEALFLQYMVESMRKTIPESELFPKSSGQKMYEGMLDTELAQQMAEKQSLGLSDHFFHILDSQLNSKK